MTSSTNDPEAKVLAYQRWHDQGARIGVVASFSDHSLVKYQIPNILVAGTRYEWTSHYEIHTKEDGLILDLPEYEAKVFVWQ